MNFKYYHNDNIYQTNKIPSLKIFKSIDSVLCKKLKTIATIKFDIYRNRIHSVSVFFLKSFGSSIMTKS